jgi:hypothetical protein
VGSCFEVFIVRNPMVRSEFNFDVWFVIYTFFSFNQCCMWLMSLNLFTFLHACTPTSVAFSDMFPEATWKSPLDSPPPRPAASHAWSPLLSMETRGEGGRRDGNGYIPIGYDLPILTPTIGKTPHHPYPSPTTGLKFPHTHHPSGSGYLAGDPYPLHYNCS